MGDRANVVLQYSNDVNIYLYTHWSGTEWPEELRKALEVGRPRWDDDAYLSRIIILEMYKDLIGSETGGGIAPYELDNSYGRPLIYVSLFDQEVTIGGVTWSFSEYVAQKEANYPKEVR